MVYKSRLFLGCRQAVSHGILDPAIGGSNPPTPALILNKINKISIGNVNYFVSEQEKG